MGENENVGGGTGSSHAFTWVFLGVLGLTILCLIGSGVVVSNMRSNVPTAAYSNDDTRQAVNKVNDALLSINEKLLSIFTLGCGAIVGLLGGKSIK